jgi:DNA topoisomerase-3
MNATRAATIRLRSSFDGAVSLGRVQTPTLAIVARREEEIRAFKPEPYWLVDARFAPVGGTPGREYGGRYHKGAKPRLASGEEAATIVAAVEGGTGEITTLDKKERRERAPMLYDLTTLQREANTRFGFSARRTLAAAQRLYEEHKALTYPRTSSRFLTTDMVPEIKPIAELVGARSEYAAGARYVTGLDVLPLQRVVDDAKVADHHAIIPTRSEHKLDKMSDDDLRVYDMVTRRFLAVFHPEAVFEQTRLETTVAGHVFRTSGKVLLVPGWRGVYGEGLEDEAGAAREDSDEGRDQQLPKLELGEPAAVRSVESAAKETKPPRRYTDASLLGAMETAGKLVDEGAVDPLAPAGTGGVAVTADEIREAMKDSGIGTPATRAAIIERLISVGYIERDGRSLVASEKGLNVVRLLDGHALTSPGLTGDWEHRLNRIEHGEEERADFMRDIAGFADSTVQELDAKLKDVKIPRANLGPCPVCGHDIMENRKGYSCWGREDPGCGFVIWKSKAGKTLTPAIVREIIATGRTAKAVTGFKGRSGRSFRARLALMQTEEGRWRVEFDEPWAQAGAKPPEGEDDPGAPPAVAADGQVAQAQRPAASAA